MGFADLAALMEFHANNPDRAEQAGGGDDGLQQHAGRGVGAEEERHHQARRPAGKKLGAPVFDAGRRGFPIFAKANGIGAVTWVSMDPPLRETMLAKGDVDAITGFSSPRC
jgi:NitT/TauT family transport system substrate-binding protein